MNPKRISLRITPAYAGKSSFASCSFASFRDHPRLCGEKVFLWSFPQSLRGSPPPMRGKGRYTDQRKDRGRITPAYAGKSFHRPFNTNRLLGSPPPMRGKAFWGIHVVLCQGITPAYAGKRPVFLIVQRGYWDHPRLCGEKYVCVKTWFEEQGSPPPMRGKAAN